MSTHRKNVNRTTRVARMVVLGVCLGFALEAGADVPARLPAQFTTLPSHDVTSPSGDPAVHADELLAGNANLRPRSGRARFRYRDLKLVSFTRAVEVGNEDVIVRVQSPGARKSIMMVELKF